MPLSIYATKYATSISNPILQLSISLNGTFSNTVCCEISIILILYYG